MAGNLRASSRTDPSTGARADTQVRPYNTGNTSSREALPDRAVVKLGLFW